MHFTKTDISGGWTIDPSPHIDHRGRFFRAWCTNEFRALGIDFVPLQANIGTSRAAGTVRGLHYQVAPHDEAKVIRCTRGAVFDVLVDLRKGSPTFGRWTGVELSAENGRMLFVPQGCATGYQTLVDDAETFYMTSAIYEPSAVRGLKFDDPSVGIEWPLPPTAVSEQDSRWPSLQDHLLGVSR